MTVSYRTRAADDTWLFQPDYEPRRVLASREQLERGLRAWQRVAIAALGLSAGLIWWQWRNANPDARPAPSRVRAPQPARGGAVPVRSRVAGWRAADPAPVSPKSESGHAVHYKKVWVTAYCPECRVCDTTDTTATGTSADTPGAAVAARGPRAIPLGGRVYVANFGWLPIDDTGGGVDSNQIDVRMQSHRAARLWGRRLMRVRVETAGG